MSVEGARKFCCNGCYSAAMGQCHGKRISLFCNNRRTCGKCVQLGERNSHLQGRIRAVQNPIFSCNFLFLVILHFQKMLTKNIIQVIRVSLVTLRDNYRIRWAVITEFVLFVAPLRRLTWSHSHFFYILFVGDFKSRTPLIIR